MKKIRLIQLLFLSLFLIGTYHPTQAQKIDTISVYSTSMKKQIKNIIILPASYTQNTQKKYPVAYLLHGYGGCIAFLVIENRKRQPKMETLEALTYQTAFFIGCFQVLAAIPGTSRSGATILGAVILGCSRYVASEFSFFLAIPVMAGASGLKLLKYFLKTGMFSGSEWILLIIGTLVSFVVSVFAIRMLLSYIRKHDFKIFGVYRIILGLIVIVYFSLLA